MNGGSRPSRRDWGSLTLCVALSLLLHLGLAWALDLLPRDRHARHHAPAARATRHVQVLRSTPRAKKAGAEPVKRETERPFAKSSPDEPQMRPESADFIGSHDSVASGEPDAPQRRSDAPLPTMAGRESEAEMVTFDQERQDGTVEHEGKLAETPPPPPPSPAPPAPEQALASGLPEGLTEPEIAQSGEQQSAQTSPESTAAQNSPPSDTGEGLKLDELHTQDALTLSLSTPSPAPLGLPEGAEHHTTAPPARSRQPRGAVYDPALTAEAQQAGLRTYERRTRSTGRFVFGSRPALNVAATPRGHYEAEVYRRIARMWYAACDEHRGDIIPGSITVSLRLTKSGSIDSMDLVRRRGASLIQQSFSFGAIRRASLPPMPREVQAGVIGKLYEMILTFNFD